MVYYITSQYLKIFVNERKLTSPKHPAPYSKQIIEALETILPEYGYKNIIDPFAGTGIRLGDLCEKLSINFYPTDIEDWGTGVPIGDATDLTVYAWAKNRDDTTIVTSPTYANAMNDHFNPKDNSDRRTYRIGLGKSLHENNTGRYGVRAGKKSMNKYMDLHRQAIDNWTNCNLPAIVNVSDFIHKKEVYPLVDWWKREMKFVGYKLVEEVDVATPRYRFGKNNEARVEVEKVMVFQK